MKQRSGNPAPSERAKQPVDVADPQMGPRMDKLKELLAKFGKFAPVILDVFSKLVDAFGQTQAKAPAGAASQSNEYKRLINEVIENQVYTLSHSMQLLYMCDESEEQPDMPEAGEAPKV